MYCDKVEHFPLSHASFLRSKLAYLERWIKCYSACMTLKIMPKSCLSDSQYVAVIVEKSMLKVYTPIKGHSNYVSKLQKVRHMVRL